MSSLEKGMNGCSTPIDNLLRIDAGAEVARIAERMRVILRDDLRRRGFVVAISGGIDSSLCAALSVSALGPERVFALILPERDSSPESLVRARHLAEHLGIAYEVKNISDTLEAIGCYHWRDAAIRRVVPEYGDSWRSKIAIRSRAHFSHFALIAHSSDGDVREERLGAQEFLQIVAATSFKQRIRKSIEYFHADRLNYAVVGTPNRLEYDQGFFVKNGDGASDVKPIAHLYKSQVYALGRYMGLPEAICNATPTTDTYSLEQGQDEFYFSLPYHEMDVAIALLNSGAQAEELAACLSIDVDRARLIYADIRRKRHSTSYLHLKPMLVEEIELSSSVTTLSETSDEEATRWGGRLQGIGPRG